MPLVRGVHRSAHGPRRLTARRRGHRLSPRAADVVVEAWGPDVAACAEEAAAGVVSVHARSGTSPVIGCQRSRLVATAPEAVVLGVVDEAIFAFDAAAGVPVGVEVVPVPGGFDVTILLADRTSFVPTGPAPKAVSHSGLEVHAGRTGVSCHFIVDV